MSVRAAFYKVGADTPYAQVYRPISPPPAGLPVILGGSLSVVRPNFPDTGTLKLSAPLAFAAGDWVRVWLSPEQATTDLYIKQPMPDYLGQIVSEPWVEGSGEVQLRPLTERLNKSAWRGKVEGDFATFWQGVLLRATLPKGLRYRTPSDINAKFAADTPFELLGDTIQAITPALGGYQIGVSAEAILEVWKPSNTVTHRFVLGRSDMPQGDYTNYANCVRFSFGLPSGDTGWFEGRNLPEVAAQGEVWAVEQLTAREAGLPDEPLAAYGVRVRQTLWLAGLPDWKLDESWSVDILSNINLGRKPTAKAALAPPYYPPKPPADTTDPWLKGWAEIGAIWNMQYNTTALLTLGEATERLAATTVQQAVGQTVASVPDAGGAIKLRLRLDQTGLPLTEALETGHLEEAGKAAVLLPFTVVSESVTEGGVEAEISIAISSQLDWNRPIWFVYAGKAAKAVWDAGRGLIPIEILPGGSIDLAYITEGATPKVFSLTLPPAQSTVTVMHWSGWGSLHKRVTLPYPVLSGRAGSTAIPDFFAYASGLTIADEGLVIDFTEKHVTLPFGSSIEIEAKNTDAAVSLLWITAQGFLGERVQYAVEDYRSQGMTFTEAVSAAYNSTNPPVSQALEPVENTPDGWLRFAVRKNAADTVLRRLYLRGKGLGRIRIRTPQLDNVQTYAAELLRYRSQPVRDWKGHYSTLKRVPADGVAAFERPLTADDELLDVQRVTYNLDDWTVEVQCGSPLPATDEDAVAGVVESLQRVQRRARGEK